MSSCFKIGDLFTLPANTEVWCIPLQESIQFKKEIIIEVTHTLIGDNKHFFAKRKIVLFNFPGCIPGICDAALGELGAISVEQCKPYELPKYEEFKYEIK